MICPYCGNQTADNSTFCIHCGSALKTPESQTQSTQAMFTQYVEPQQTQTQYQQPAVQAPVMQEPVAQPQYQQPPVNNNYAAGFADAVRQYIEMAGSVLAPSIVGLALSWFIPLIGQIIGLVMAGNVNSKLALLPIIDEAALDPSILDNYHSARRKAKTAGILSKINKIYSIVTLIFWIVYIAFFALYFIGIFAFVGMY